MEVVKQIFAIVGAGIGVLSGVVTLYAKYLDIRKKATGGDPADDSPAPAAPKLRRHRRKIADGPPRLYGQFDRPEPDESEVPPVVVEVWPPVPAAAAIRSLVRPPAIAMMVAGGLGLVFNLAVAGFGYVDEFVTPLTTETQARHAAEAAGRTSPTADAERTSATLGAVTLLGFAVASAAAVWAGYNMLRLRSYWLSVAGSIAIMPGACVCGLAGFPIGVWSVVVLFRPGVADAFR